MPTFNCPTCNKPVEWSSAAQWRPFCSERCRLIDLGAWMSEQRSIPGPEAADGTGEAGLDEPLSADDSRRH
jgi:endogenous inhibitor of DNA gyrase (YacG/DUF329 family)